MEDDGWHTHPYRASVRSTCRSAQTHVDEGTPLMAIGTDSGAQGLCNLMACAGSPLSFTHSDVATQSDARLRLGGLLLFGLRLSDSQTQRDRQTHTHTHDATQSVDFDLSRRCMHTPRLFCICTACSCAGMPSHLLRGSKNGPVRNHHEIPQPISH